MKKTATIDLERFRTPGSRVFTGRDRGIFVREKSEINKLESENEEVNIIVPNDIGSINPSFLEEFLFDVVSKLKEDHFFNKIKFITTGRYTIENDLQEAVERILREENALIH